LNQLCSEFAFVKRAWDLNASEKKTTILSTTNLSPEGIARNCRHAITERGKRFIGFVIRGHHTASAYAK
jgi:hypothetical protein